MLIILLLAATICGVIQPRADSGESSTPKARVLIVNHSEATRAFSAQPAPIREMINQGLTRFTGKETVPAAWLSLISTQDTVGLKVHSAPGAISGTRPAVVGAVIESLLAAGIPPQQIIIWDRRSVELRLAGFYDLALRYGVSAAGAMDEGYDPDHAYEVPLLGKLVYGDTEFGKKGEGIGRKSYVSKLLTKRITRIVNITPLLNHNFAGVSGVLFGLAMSSVDNILRFEDTQRLSTAVPEIYALPEIADRVALNIVDALICQYRGEERSLLHYSTALNEIWFSTDPLAIDTLALRELEREKGQDGRRMPGKQIYYNAGLMDLGTGDLKKINVERIQLSPLNVVRPKSASIE